MESSRSAGRTRQRETVALTSWSKITVLRHLAEVTLPTLRAPIDRLSNPLNRLRCCQNSGKYWWCRWKLQYLQTRALFHTGQNGSASSRQNINFVNLQVFLSSTRVIKLIVIKNITISIQQSWEHGRSKCVKYDKNYIFLMILVILFETPKRDRFTKPRRIPSRNARQLNAVPLGI